MGQGGRGGVNQGLKKRAMVAVVHMKGRRVPRPAPTTAVSIYATRKEKRKRFSPTFFYPYLENYQKQTWRPILRKARKCPFWVSQQQRGVTLHPVCSLLQCWMISIEFLNNPASPCCSARVGIEVPARAAFIRKAGNENEMTLLIGLTSVFQ